MTQAVLSLTLVCQRVPTLSLDGPVITFDFDAACGYVGMVPMDMEDHRVGVALAAGCAWR